MKTVLITGARSPVALHLARLFAAAGHKVLLADTLNHPLAKSSSFCSRYFKLPSPDQHPHEFAQALRTILEHHSPEWIVPTCEEVFYLAWAFETFKLPGKLFAPSFTKLSRAHNKAQFAVDAKSFRLNPPETLILNSKADIELLKNRSRDLVFKPIWSRFASSILIRPHPAKLNRIDPSPQKPWIAQAYVPGKDFCCYAIADNGNLLATSTYHPAFTAGKGAGIYFDPVINEQITSQSARYAKATAWTGQLSFDFREDKDGQLRVLECNPRTTSGVHFFGPGSALAHTITNGTPTGPTIDSPLMIPAAMVLFALPQATKNLTPANWWRNIRRAGNALHWPSDRLPALAQTRAIIELATIAAQKRTSLITASTAGIAWNGTPIGPSHAPPRNDRSSQPDTQT